VEPRPRRRRPGAGGAAVPRCHLRPVANSGECTGPGKPTPVPAPTDRRAPRRDCGEVRPRRRFPRRGLGAFAGAGGDRPGTLPRARPGE
jgi:hypothetical protein